MINAKEANILTMKAKSTSRKDLQASFEKNQRKFEKQIKKAAKNQKDGLTFIFSCPTSFSEDEMLGIAKNFFEPLGYTTYLMPNYDENKVRVRIYWGDE